MTNMRTGSVMILSVLVLLSAVGCYDKKDQQIKQLYADKQALLKKNQQISKDLVAAQAENAERLTALDNKDAQLVALKADNATLRKENTDLTAKVAVGVTRPVPQPQPQPQPQPWGKPERTLTLGGDVLFSSGKAALSTGGRAAVERVVASLQSSRGARLLVVGHTDSQKIKKSSWRDNYELSVARAMAVKQYLVSRGIPGSSIQTRGVGPDQPVASNRTASGRAQNRRVEVQVFPATRAPTY